MGVDRAFDYKSIPTQQVKNYFNIFSKFFENEKIENVIEIGTSYGGLSLFLYEQSLIHGFDFFTIDISDKRMKDAWSEKTIPFVYYVSDCFTDEIFTKISNILSLKKTLLLCDGGNKILEFNTFSSLLQSGSFIMAHDYSPNWDYFNTNIKNITWDWCEIRDENIEQSFEFVQKSKYYDEFLKISWISCFRG